MSSTEAQFLEKTDLSKYQGKWVAVLDKEIIVSGKNIEEVFTRAKSKAKNKTPLFQYIPESGEVF